MGKRYKYTVSGNTYYGGQETVTDIDTAYEAEYWAEDLQRRGNADVTISRIQRGRRR